jgi:hypothetical protein
LGTAGSGQFAAAEFDTGMVPGEALRLAGGDGSVPR